MGDQEDVSRFRSFRPGVVTTLSGIFNEFAARSIFAVHSSDRMGVWVVAG